MESIVVHGSLNLKMNLTQIIDGYPGHEHSFPIFPLYKDVIELVAQSKTTYTPTFLVDYGGPWGENWFYETGKLADLVILDKNPLDNIRHTNAISQVMKNGRLYDANTLDEVWPRQRKLEKLWWWDLEPSGVPGMEK